ncbi:cytochrome P450 [Lentzea tibetensis]|uniref:Cytochrome P450 n=1 Tax=Lentzea tibetensis TaxID=2591470 RepID=A0A563ERV6_9PSEU|nr:cytochrome P450 [Lentzea tibetensis]TWP50383.1 cytochrome P450 [Lentzea tibetensis]
MTDIVAPQEILELFDDGYVRDPHPVLAALRASSPVHVMATPNGIKTWVVTGYDEARALLVDPRLSKDMRVGYGLIPQNFVDPVRRAEFLQEVGTRKQFATELSTTMLDSDPPDHTRLRRLVGKAFTARRVEALRPRIVALTDELLDALEGKQSADLIEELAFPIPFTVICWLLGIPQDDRATFRGWSNTLTSGSGGEEVLDASEAMVVYLRGLIADKRAEPGEDMLSELIQVRDEGDKLDETELMSMAFLLLVAGHETTVNMLGTGVLALLTHPDQRALVEAEEGLWPGAVDEILRYDAPLANATWRYTTEPIEVAGVHIPAQEFVTIALGAAGRDPAKYADPDRLDVRRAAAGHLSFGHGIHHCVGAPLARMEGQIVLSRLFQRFPKLRLAVEPGQAEWRPSFNLRGLASLPVALS